MRVGNFSNGCCFSMECSLHGNLSNLFLRKRNNSLVVIQSRRDLGAANMHPAPVKKMTSQKLWPRIHGSIKTAQRLQKSREARVFFLPRQPRNFEIVVLVARRRKHFGGVLAIFLVSQLPPRRCIIVHKNSVASCQLCRHSVEARALTCLFKQNDLSAWSLLS